MKKIFLLVGIVLSLPAMNPSMYLQQEPKNIFEAAILGDMCAIEGLLQKGVDVNARNQCSGKTALKIASFYGHTAIVEFLLSKKADPNIPDEDGDTALMATVTVQPLEIAQLLLQNGANPNIPNKYGETALMRAIWYNRTDIIKEFLEHDANPHLKDEQGSSALSIAKELGLLDTVELIENFNKEQQKKKKKTP